RVEQIPLSPRQLAAVGRYCWALLREGYLFDAEADVEKRHVRHNEAVGVFLHHELVGLINRIVPKPVKASYSFLSIYKPGAVLERHVDRAQCEWNLSVVLDCQPDPKLAADWPIYLKTKRGVQAARLNVGDGVLYRGSKVPHWRDRQSNGRFTTVCFFHFVGQGFKGALD